VPEVGQFKNTFAANFEIGAAIQDNQTPDTSEDAHFKRSIQLDLGRVSDET
jgi:hypothetical protein